MNAPTGKLTGAEDSDIHPASFYRLRSEVLDCFADIERALMIYVSRHNQSICLTSPLGQKVETARKVPAGPSRSKGLKAKADAELDKLAELLPVRASIVHSRMEIAATISGRLLAIFRNSKEVGVDHPTALLFTIAELQDFVVKLRMLEKSLVHALIATNPIAKPKA